MATNQTICAFVCVSNSICNIHSSLPVTGGSHMTKMTPCPKKTTHTHTKKKLKKESQFSVIFSGMRLGLFQQTSTNEILSEAQLLNPLWY